MYIEEEKKIQVGILMILVRSLGSAVDGRN